MRGYGATHATSENELERVEVVGVSGGRHDEGLDALVRPEIHEGAWYLPQPRARQPSKQPSHSCRMMVNFGTQIVVMAMRIRWVAMMVVMVTHRRF